MQQRILCHSCRNLDSGLRFLWKSSYLVCVFLCFLMSTCWSRVFHALHYPLIFMEALEFLALTSHSSNTKFFKRQQPEIAWNSHCMHWSFSCNWVVFTWRAIQALTLCMTRCTILLMAIDQWPFKFCAWLPGHFTLWRAGLTHHFMFPLGESSELAEAGDSASRIFRKSETQSEEPTLHLPWQFGRAHRDGQRGEVLLHWSTMRCCCQACWSPAILLGNLFWGQRYYWFVLGLCTRSPQLFQYWEAIQIVEKIVWVGGWRLQKKITIYFCSHNGLITFGQIISSVPRLNNNLYKVSL